MTLPARSIVVDGEVFDVSGKSLARPRRDAPAWRPVYHIRRRLTDAEREAAGGLVVRDVRGTPEEAQRLRRLLRDAPHLRGVIT